MTIFRSSNSLARASKAGLLLSAGFALLGVGYFIGQRERIKTIPQSSAAPSPRNLKQQPLKARLEAAPPLALAEMKKAVILVQQNPDAWRAKYLNKTYRVVGNIYSVVGTTQSEPDTTMLGYSGSVFRITLKPWDLPSSIYPSDFLGPEMSFIDLPQETREAMRPGQYIDATCILTSQSLKFAYCRMNEVAQK